MEYWKALNENAGGIALFLAVPFGIYIMASLANISYALGEIYRKLDK